MPSIEIRIPASLSSPVNSVLVNYLPWFVLKISGGSYLLSASSSASQQKDGSSVFDSLQEKTQRGAASGVPALSS